jgi:hypothetical protein
MQSRHVLIHPPEHPQKSRKTDAEQRGPRSTGAEQSRTNSGAWPPTALPHRVRDRTDVETRLAEDGPYIDVRARGPAEFRLTRLNSTSDTVSDPPLTRTRCTTPSSASDRDRLIRFICEYSLEFYPARGLRVISYAVELFPNTALPDSPGFVGCLCVAQLCTTGRSIPQAAFTFGIGPEIDDIHLHQDVGVVPATSQEELVMAFARWVRERARDAHVLLVGSFSEHAKGDPSANAGGATVLSAVLNRYPLPHTETVYHTRRGTGVSGSSAFGESVHVVDMREWLMDDLSAAKESDGSDMASFLRACGWGGLAPRSTFVLTEKHRMLSNPTLYTAGPGYGALLSDCMLDAQCIHALVEAWQMLEKIEALSDATKNPLSFVLHESPAVNGLLCLCRSVCRTNPSLIDFVSNKNNARGLSHKFRFMQLAEKLKVNCVYGLFGDRHTSYWYDVARASLVALCGRIVINQAKNVVERSWGAVRYMDTDSLCVELRSDRPMPPATDAVACRARWAEYAGRINEEVRASVPGNCRKDLFNLTLEAVFAAVHIPQKMKRYLRLGLMPNGDTVFDQRGMALSAQASNVRRTTLSIAERMLRAPKDAWRTILTDFSKTEVARIAQSPYLYGTPAVLGEGDAGPVRAVRTTDGTWIPSSAVKPTNPVDAEHTFCAAYGTNLKMFFPAEYNDLAVVRTSTRPRTATAAPGDLCLKEHRSGIEQHMPFEHYLSLVPATKKSYHEVITSKLVRVFFDIDGATTTDGARNAFDVDAFTDHVRRTLGWKRPIVLSAPSPTKQSYHIFYRKKIALLLLRVLARKLQETFPEIDTGVYTVGHTLRLFGCPKWNFERKQFDHRPFVVPPGVDPMDCFVTNVRGLRSVQDEANFLFACDGIGRLFGTWPTYRQLERVPASILAALATQGCTAHLRDRRGGSYCALVPSKKPYTCLACGRTHCHDSMWVRWVDSNSVKVGCHIIGKTAKFRADPMDQRGAVAKTTTGRNDLAKAMREYIASVVLPPAKQCTRYVGQYPRIRRIISVRSALGTGKTYAVDGYTERILQARIIQEYLRWKRAQSDDACMSEERSGRPVSRSHHRSRSCRRARAGRRPLHQLRSRSCPCPVSFFRPPTYDTSDPEMVVVALTARRSQASDLHHQRIENFEEYRDLKDPRIDLSLHSKLIIQIDSLVRVDTERVQKIDLLVLDELETLLDQLYFNGTPELVEAFSKILRLSTHIVIADAFLEPFAWELVAFLAGVHDDEIVHVTNSYKPFGVNQLSDGPGKPLLEPPPQPAPRQPPPQPLLEPPPQPAPLQSHPPLPLEPPSQPSTLQPPPQTPYRCTVRQIKASVPDELGFLFSSIIADLELGKKLFCAIIPREVATLLYERLRARYNAMMVNGNDLYVDPRFKDAFQEGSPHLGNAEVVNMYCLKVAVFGDIHAALQRHNTQILISTTTLTCLQTMGRPRSLIDSEVAVFVDIKKHFGPRTIEECIDEYDDIVKDCTKQGGRVFLDFATMTRMCLRVRNSIHAANALPLFLQGLVEFGYDIVVTNREANTVVDPLLWVKIPKLPYDEIARIKVYRNGDRIYRLKQLECHEIRGKMHNTDPELALALLKYKAMVLFGIVTAEAEELLTPKLLKCCMTDSRKRRNAHNYVQTRLDAYSQMSSSDKILALNHLFKLAKPTDRNPWQPDAVTANKGIFKDVEQLHAAAIGGVVEACKARTGACDSPDPILCDKLKKSHGHSTAFAKWLGSRPHNNTDTEIILHPNMDAIRSHVDYKTIGPCAGPLEIHILENDHGNLKDPAYWPVVNRDTRDLLAFAASIPANEIITPERAGADSVRNRSANAISKLDQLLRAIGGELVVASHKQRVLKAYKRTYTVRVNIAWLRANNFCN